MRLFHKRIWAAALLFSLLLTGCAPMLERSYSASSPHVQFSDESENEAILRAETYQGLVSALLYLVGKGEEAGVIRLYQYAGVTGTAASDVDRACLEVTQEDPMGAYAVDYIKYDVEQTPAYYQVDVKLAYTKTPEELARVISVTGSSAVSRELEELLKDRPEQVVFRISYFTAGESEETLRQAVEEAYAGQTVPLPPLEDVQITLYPAAGPQRVAEITLVWGEENLEENQGTALDTETET
ncbi:MAG: hypothetical protein IJU29_04565 [Oscillospiraceae bacterium]|nr:hypothetical protein [Oscillospiraceae bacterium]